MSCLLRSTKRSKRSRTDNLTKIYLVTGFLGAGKTTFLKEFVRIFDGKKISVIVNEFGKAGVDGALLSDLALTLAEIDNGSIFCVCQLPNFERTLAAQLEEEPDVIVVEASGLADPTSVGGILADSTKFPTAEYAGAICLVDASASWLKRPAWSSASWR